MLNLKNGFIGTAAATVMMVSGQAQAEWPSKPIEFIIPFGAGGGADIEGRLIAKAMSKELGQPVVPINKPGGGGAITYTYVKNSKPDGHTLAWNSTSILTTTNIGNVPFDYTAMDHIGQVAQQPVPFVVKKSARWNTLKEFMAECKAKPKTLKVAFAGFGSATHLAGVAMTQLSGCKPIMLPVKGSRPPQNDTKRRSRCSRGYLFCSFKVSQSG